jgi:YVTN family beta-propeller protein
MPHGVKVNHAGTRVYVSCMNSDEILEIDRARLTVTRRYRTGAGMAPAVPMPAGHGGAQGGGRPHDACMPTFVSVSPDDRRLYVACNHSDQLLVLDAAALQLVKSVATGHGPYNVEPSPDGRWVTVTNKKDQSVSLVDAATLAEVARIRTSKPFPHGVAYSPDNRAVFVSQESKGVDPGAVDVIDLASRAAVAAIDVPLQPTGITVLVLP